jgi:pyruvate kinase
VAHRNDHPSAGVRPGERIWFDDGKTGGVIREVEATLGVLRVEITQARPGGSRLRAGRGINLPDSALRAAALTAKDEQDLSFVAAHADMVGLSCVRTPEPVRAPDDILRRMQGHQRKKSARLRRLRSWSTGAGGPEAPGFAPAAGGRALTQIG